MLFRKYSGCIQGVARKVFEREILKSFEIQNADGVLVPVCGLQCLQFLENFLMCVL